MAICLIIENPDQTRAHTEQGMAHVRGSGPVPPEGARLLFGGPAEDGWRFISVWDSQDELDRFLAERLEPAYRELDLPTKRASRTVFEVATLTAGDLTGTPQAAAR